MKNPKDDATDVRLGHGIYVQIYASTLVQASRMFKIAKSAHAAGYFRETHLVGVRGPGQPEREKLSPEISVIRIHGSRRRGNLGRILKVLVWQPRVFLRYRNQPITLIAAHNVWVLPLCWLLARVSGAPVVYNAHELETETYRMIGPKQRLAKSIEATLIGRCSLISVVNESIADWYEKEYAVDRPIVVPNMPTVRRVDVRLRERLGVSPDEMLYIHTGNLVEARNIPLILEAFAASPHHVVFLGDGHMRESILAASRIHSNIHWLPPVDADLIVAHVMEADVGLCLIEPHSLSDRLSSPNKLLESLAAGVPPLCSDLVEARRFLGAFAGLWILSDPAKELPRTLRILSKKDVAEFRSARPELESWETLAKPLINGYGRVLNAHHFGSDQTST